MGQAFDAWQRKIDELRESSDDLDPKIKAALARGRSGKGEALALMHKQTQIETRAKLHIGQRPPEDE